MLGKIFKQIVRDYKAFQDAIHWRIEQEKYKAHASKKEFDWDWSAVHYNRIALTNYLLRQVQAERPRYLEIGCYNDALFNSVAAETKVGVDPEKGGTHRMTSDDFFAQNTETFDVIFIDGLHEYEQVRRDAINALNCLAPNGYVAFHDFLPRNWKEHHVPRLQSVWTGDCWKSAYELSKTDGIDFRIVKIDYGVGVMKKTVKNPKVVDLTDTLREKQFDFYAEIVDELPLIEWSEFSKWARK